jgi:hypothetical protein
MILEGWRDAILAGRYLAVRYDCTSTSVVHWINSLAKKVGLTGPSFSAVLQPSAEEIAALPPAAADGDEPPITKPQPSAEAAPPRDEQPRIAAVRAAAPSASVHMSLPELPPQPKPETAEAAAERERRYREIFEIPQPNPRRRWRG